MTILRRLTSLTSLAVLSWLLYPATSFAHEVYVLTKPEWQAGLQATGVNLWAPLSQPANLGLVAAIGIGALIGLAAALYFWSSKLGQKTDRYLLHWQETGRLLLRLSLGIALIVGARAGTIFGPELAINPLALGHYLPYILYALGALTIFGWMTELAALALLITYILAIVAYGLYPLTYLNYVGELAALLLVGAGLYSIDGWTRRREVRKSTLNLNDDIEAFIIRFFYGASFVFTAITVKFMHPTILIEVINKYHLTQYHLLFPSDPVLVALGVAIVECLLGLFIVLGFQTRFTILFMLFYLTLSVLFFRESVWPHLMLYGISFYLLTNNGGRISVDHWLSQHLRPK